MPSTLQFVLRRHPVVPLSLLTLWLTLAKLLLGIVFMLKLPIQECMEQCIDMGQLLL